MSRRRVLEAMVFTAVALTTTIGIGASGPLDEPPSPEPAAKSRRESKEKPTVSFGNEIVVTAQKREEKLLEVPIAVTALTSSAVEQMGVRRPEDVLALTPNALFANTLTVGSSFVTIRGLTQVNNGDPPVAVVVDGVYLGNQKQLVQELFDIERIEVLKGPQGALYGRNAIGGAINIVTRQPGNDIGGFVMGSAGNGRSFGLTAALGVPVIKDRLFFRTAAAYKDSDGLIENVFLHRKADPLEDTTGRVDLRWVVSDRAWLDIRAARSVTHGGASIYTTFPDNGSANDFRYRPDSDVLGRSDRSLGDYSLRAVFEGKACTLTSITSYGRVDESFKEDLDFSNPTRPIPAPLGQIGAGQDLAVDLVSQEVRVASPDTRRLRWLGGVYLLQTGRQLTTTLYSDTDGTFAGFRPLLALAETNHNLASAGFGQVDADLTSHWRASLSARYDRDRRRQTDRATGHRREIVFPAWQPRLTISYLPNSTLTFYASLGTGFRSGGFNAPTVHPDVFREERTKNAEAGFKTALLAGRGSLDGAAYFMRVDHFQFFRVEAATASQIIDNIRKVEIKGLEATLLLRPWTGWEFSGALGLNDSRILAYNGTGSFRGNQTPNSIRGTLHAGAQYGHLLGRSVLATARADLYRRGRQYWTPDNLDVQNAVSLLDVRLSAAWRSWSLTGWGRNLTDRRYYLEYNDAAWAGILSGLDIAQLGPPRTYGIELRRDF